MKTFAKLERKLGKYAIRNLMKYLVALYALGAIIFMMDPMLYFRYLTLDFDMIIQGQIWRLFTFLLYPISTNYFMILITLYIYYILGNILEQIWGSFRFNFFIFSGIIILILASLFSRVVLQLPIGTLYPIGNSYLNLSIFLLFALTNPEQQFLFFFIIPIKAKYIALIDLIYFIIGIYKGGPDRIEAIAMLITVALMIWLINGGQYIYRVKNRKRKQAFSKKYKTGSTEFDNLRKESKNIPNHRCSICGITDKDDPNMDFRYCSKCNGMFEYCSEHIHKHEHKL